MAIEFHCVHCNLVIKAPEESGGKKGRCPHCKGVCYIPMPADQVGEYDVAPLDPQEERRRQAALSETAQLQHEILHDRSKPDERGGRGGAARGGAGAGAERGSAVRPPESARERVVAYVEAMSEGRLEDAERYAFQLAAQKAEVLKLIERIMVDDVAAAGMPAVPRPVLVGFLKQLQARM